VAQGVYPDRKRTKVSDVAVYQNDGTQTIKPAKFVESAARSRRNWQSPVFRAVGKWLDGNEHELSRVGRIIARDINDRCNRIKTGRLTHSFVHRFKRV
jgi:hypothetical protein